MAGIDMKNYTVNEKKFKRGWKNELRHETMPPTDKFNMCARDRFSDSRQEEDYHVCCEMSLYFHEKLFMRDCRLL